MSGATRAKIAAAARLRWAKRKESSRTLQNMERESTKAAIPYRWKLAKLLEGRSRFKQYI
jgi:hypothetical protein